MLIETTAAAPRIRLEVPPDFHQVPLERETELRTASQLQVLDVMGLSHPDQREALSLYLEGLAVRLTTADVGGSAFCAVQLHGRPSTATLTVGLQSTRTLDRGLSLLGAAEALRRDQRYSTVTVVELGNQPAATAVAERPMAASGAPDGPTAVLREMLAFLPVQGHPWAALLTLATPCHEDWDTYVAVLLDICRSLHVERSASALLR